MIRLSSTQFVYNYKNTLNQAYTKQGELIAQADGGKLHRPSDDAVGYAKYLRYAVSDNENEQYQDNVKNGISWMKMSDSAMISMSEIMTTFKEKTVAAANSTNTVSDMQAIGKEMMAEIQHLVSLGNTQQGDRYLFSGQSDLTRPFNLSEEGYWRGLTKTLDDQQSAFFNTADSSGSMKQMLALKANVGGQDGTYYLDTVTGNIYEKDFVESGYKSLMLKGQEIVDPAADAVGNVSGFSVAEYFNNLGAIYDESSTATSPVLYDGTGTMKRLEDVSITLNGTPYTVDMDFDTREQQLVSYSGDQKYISMVKLNGAIDPSADTVNATGKDLFGTDIFDDPASGNDPSGCAMLNELLTVHTMVCSDDPIWLDTDGVTIADAAHATVSTAETKVGARQQLYQNVSDMLVRQSEHITSDINDVSAADMAELAVQLMEQQTLYNLALSFGSRILPQSLADYL